VKFHGCYYTEFQKVFCGLVKLDRVFKFTIPDVNGPWKLVLQAFDSKEKEEILSITGDKKETLEFKPNNPGNRELRKNVLPSSFDRARNIATLFRFQFECQGNQYLSYPFITANLKKKKESKKEADKIQTYALSPELFTDDRSEKLTEKLLPYSSLKNVNSWNENLHKKMKLNHETEKGSAPISEEAIRNFTIFLKKAQIYSYLLTLTESDQSFE